MDESSLPELSSPTRRKFLIGAGAAVLATLAKPVTSFAALEEVLSVDTTSQDGAFWAAQGRASFVVLGDFGAGFINPQKEFTGAINVNAKAVADGIRRVLPYHADGPIICVGDAIYVPFDGHDSPEYPNTPTTWLATNLSPYDQAIGVLYHHYIRFPKGSPCRFAKHGAARQRFMTVLGDHDWWHAPRREVSGKPEFLFDDATYGRVRKENQPMYTLTPDAPYRDYFGNQGGNLRFFTRTDGRIEWFALSSDANETLHGTLRNAYYFGPFPNGYHPGRDNEKHSVQGRWLRKAVRASKAHWKFVNTHYPPYTSSKPGLGGHYSALYMRWNYAKYGIDAVFSGHVHAYERLYVDGVTYVVSGAGGTFESLAYFDQIQPGSQRREAGRYGFVSATESGTGKIFFRYLAVRSPGDPRPPAVRDRFVLVRGGILDQREEIESQDGIHITSGGGRIRTAGFDAAIRDSLLGTGLLRKDGAGVLRFNGSNPHFTGRIRAEAGIITLAADQSLGEKAAWTLAGGSLHVLANNQGSTRPLTVAADSQIFVAAGATMSFADSSGTEWRGRLAVTSQGPLRFGTNAGGLSAAQLARIYFPDNPAARAALDASGRLQAVS